MNMQTRTGQNILELLRAAFADSGKSLKRVSVESNVPFASVHRCMTGDSDVLTETASKMLTAMGMEIVIRPVRRKRKA